LLLVSPAHEKRKRDTPVVRVMIVEEEEEEEEDLTIYVHYTVIVIA
jgi:hypothetical protein